MTRRNLCHRHQGHPNQNEASFIAGVNTDSVETIRATSDVWGTRQNLCHLHQGHPNQNEAGFIAGVNTDSVETIWATSDGWVIVVEHRMNIYSKICIKWPLSKRPKIGFQDQLSLNAGQKYCRMLPLEHSAILSTVIKLSFVIKTFVLSIFE